MKRHEFERRLRAIASNQMAEHGGAAPISQVKIAAKVYESAILSFVVSTMPS
jgi:hypothetical protein